MIVTKGQEFNGHTDCIYTAAVDLASQKLYTAGGDGILAAWDTQLGGNGVMQARVKSAIYSICLFGKKILLGSNTGNLFVINPEATEAERNIEAHQQGIFDIVYDEERNLILTAGYDGILNVWDEGLNLIRKVPLSEKSLRNICMLPGIIAIASSDFKIYLLDRSSFKVFEILEHHTNSVFALAYNPARNELLSGGRDCYVKIWDATTATFKHDYPGATLHINHITFNPSNTLYAVSSMDKKLRIFDAETHLPLKFIDKEKYDGHTSSVNKSIWLNNSSLISIADDKKAMSWYLN